MTTEPNDLAYPAMDLNSYAGVERMELRHNGLTKREYFAGLAMQGILSGRSYYVLNDRTKAEYAIIMADLLIEELNKL